MRFEMRENAGRLPLLAGAYQGLGKMFHAIEDPFEECFFIFFSFFFCWMGRFVAYRGRVFGVIEDRVIRDSINRIL